MTRRWLSYLSPLLGVALIGAVMLMLGWFVHATLAGGLR